MLFADEELSQQVASVIAQIRKRNATVSVAESLTGGLLAAAFVAVPGVSDIFCGGAVTYTNEMKIKVLGVDSELLACGGAVQAEVAAQMASGVAKLYGTEFAIATTGVAGPGASAGKLLVPSLLG
ncbi:CinA family protein [Arcanobacterium hippocoleae]|uniref:CinA family protein n=1 Tax=Arcanobacterium hippocoleae TaxID=149017 RepID=UPI003341A77A